MKAYEIRYELKGRGYTIRINAKDVDSAKKKIGKKHGYKSGRMINIKEVMIIGYF